MLESECQYMHSGTPTNRARCYYGTEEWYFSQNHQPCYLDSHIIILNNANYHQYFILNQADSHIMYA